MFCATSAREPLPLVEHLAGLGEIRASPSQVISAPLRRDIQSTYMSGLITVPFVGYRVSGGSVTITSSMVSVVAHDDVAAVALLGG